MKWIRNRHGSYHSDCGRFFLQKTPKGFFQVHYRESAEAAWGPQILKVCDSPKGAQEFAASHAA